LHQSVNESESGCSMRFTDLSTNNVDISCEMGLLASDVRILVSAHQKG